MVTKNSGKKRTPDRAAPKSPTEFPKQLRDYTDFIVKAALAEDVGSGDITTEALVPKAKRGSCRITAKEGLVVCGLAVAEKVFMAVDGGLTFTREAKEGGRVRNGRAVATVSGRLRSILTAERVALNFLQRLSGIATLTSDFVSELEGMGGNKGAKRTVRILDTRKTTPCLRLLEKYAVRVGGGFNHRIGLFDAVLIKDNHIKAAGGVTAALGKIRRLYPEGVTIEIEAKTLGEVRQAASGGADIIMLDNMNRDAIKKAVAIIDERAMVEVSGGVKLTNLKTLAASGVDFISVGALTHSARSVDMGLDIRSA